MKEKYFECYKKENGALIVEATYVFPIVILVICLMIYAGNAYLQKCKVESIVTQEILKGAAYCGEPVTMGLEKGEGLPSYGSIDVKPYRFWFEGMDDVVTSTEDAIKTKISGMGGGLFRNMEVEDVEVEVNFNNSFLYSTLSADVSYEITLPIRMLGQEEPTIMKFDARVDVPVSDSVELIRNIDMIEDYLQRWSVYNDAIDKISELVSTLKAKVGM